MKKFWKDFKNSIWGKEHYEIMASRSLRDGLGYFSSLIFIVCFIALVLFSILVLPKGVRFANEMLYLSIEKYPKDLVINIQGGLASTTVDRVYKMEITNEFFDQNTVDFLKNKNVENFIVIDTKNNFESIKQFTDAKTIAFLSKDIVVLLGDRKTEIYKINEQLKETINKDNFSQLILKIISSIKYIVPLMIILGFIFMFLASYLIYIILALISALLIKVVSRFYGRDISFKESFITALYATTLTVLIGFLLSYPSYIFMILSVILTVFVWFINSQIWKKKELPSKDVNLPPANV